VGAMPRRHAIALVTPARLAFRVLVDPNGSGKSSLLDVIALPGDLLRVGLPAALLGQSGGGAAEQAPLLHVRTWRPDMD